MSARYRTRAWRAAARRHDVSDVFIEAWDMIATYQTDDELANHMIAQRNPNLVKYIIKRYMDEHGQAPYDMQSEFMEDFGMEFPKVYFVALHDDISETGHELLRVYPKIPKWIHEWMYAHHDMISIPSFIDSDKWFEDICKMLVTNPNLERLEFTYRGSLSNEMVAILAQYLPRMNTLETLILDFEFKHEIPPTNLDLLIPDVMTYDPTRKQFSELRIIDYVGAPGTTCAQLATALRSNVSLTKLVVHSTHDGEYLADDDKALFLNALRPPGEYNSSLMFMELSEIDEHAAAAGNNNIEAEIEQLLEDRRTRAGIESP